mgnify:CR=1 FL=1
MDLQHEVVCKEDKVAIVGSSRKLIKDVHGRSVG